MTDILELVLSLIGGFTVGRALVGHWRKPAGKRDCEHTWSHWKDFSHSDIGVVQIRRCSSCGKAQTHVS